MVGQKMPPGPSHTALMAARPQMETEFTNLEDSAGKEGGPDLLNSIGGEALQQARRQRKRVNLVEHTHSSKITLYDQQGDAHVVPLMNLSACLAGGLLDACPKCGSQHDSISPNACPARPKLLYTLCPICATHGKERRIWEERLHAEDTAEHEVPNDPNYVAPAMPSRKNREQALAGKLRLHMRAFHAGEAEAIYGIAERSGGAA